MVREISSGGVVVRRGDQGWLVAVIEPQIVEPQAEDKKLATKKKAAAKPLLALPKGLIDAGENPEQAALREVSEETGITATVVAKLADIKYVYVRTWGDKERVFKIVSFYLLRYESGELDDVSVAMRVEVKRAMWLPLEEVAKKLSYKGERDVLQKARDYLNEHTEIQP
jgi:8-oxo-dGTP pyrophosphatase MutT (NUDIX family)